jgi:transposase
MGCVWRDPPRDYGPRKTIYNRFVERDMPQLRQPGFFRQLQHVQKQPRQRRQTLSEVGDRAKISRVCATIIMKSTRPALAFAILREE